MVVVKPLTLEDVGQLIWSKDTPTILPRQRSFICNCLKLCSVQRWSEKFSRLEEAQSSFGGVLGQPGDGPEADPGCKGGLGLSGLAANLNLDKQKTDG